MEDKATLRELREKYLVDRRWKDLVDVVQREIAVTDDREERLDLYEMLGTVYVEHIGDAVKAYDAFRTVIDLRDDWSEADSIEVYEQLLELEPTFEPAFERLDDALRRAGDTASLQKLASHYIDFAAQHAADDEAFLRYQSQAANIFEKGLGDPGSALVVLVASLSIENWHSGVLDEIERLAGLTGEWVEPIERLERVVGEMTHGPPAADVHRRLAHWIAESGFGDPVDHLRLAYEYHTEDEVLWRTLRQALDQRSRYGELADLLEMRRQRARSPEEADRLLGEMLSVLEEAAERTSDAKERGRLLSRIGHLYEREKGNRMTAVRYWERALNAEPDTLDAARPLIDHYMSDNRWERAAPVLEVVVKHAERNPGELEPRELNQRYLQYGLVLDKVGNEKLALHAYRQAYELDRTNPKTLQRLGHLLYEADEFDQAYHVFVQLADRHERAISAETLLDVLRKAARIKLRHKDYRIAMGLIDRAVRVNSSDRETLKLAAEIAEASGEKALAVQARQKLVQSETDPRVKFAELVRMGDSFMEDGEAESGGKAYVAALEIEPTSVAVLRKLLEAFRSMQRWSEAIGVLERLVELEDDRQKRAHLYYTMGILARDQVQAPQRAVGYFDLALDENPDLLKAFEAIDRIFTELKRWKDLERAYRRMLHRVAETDVDLSSGRRADLNFLLWKSIGEVYRSRLGDLKTASEAFEAAIAIRDDDDIRMILADLYERTGANTDGAIAQHRKLLQKDSMRAESYHALYKAYLERKEFDAAFCVAGALSAMDESNHEEADYYRKYLGLNLKLAKGTFYPELLDKVYPRSQNRMVNAIMAHLTIALREMFAHPVKDFGVHPKKDRVAEDDNRLLVAQMYRYVAGILGMNPAPLLFIREDHPLGLRILNSDPPAMLAGSDMLEDRGDDRAMVFRLAKLLAWMRPEHFLAAIGNSPQDLHLIFVSAMDWAAGRSPSGGREGAGIVKRLKSAPQQTQMQLQALLQQYMQRASGPPDMGVWVSNAEHTTSRFGLILCGDIRTATQCIKAEPQAMTLATVTERVRDLIAFSATERYFRIRADLRLAIA